MKRHSKQRDAVRSALYSVDCHPTATNVYDIVREEFPNISLATVYRNLSEMRDDGDAIMLTTESGSVHYDAFTAPHSHLHCAKCGKVLDLSIELPDLCNAANKSGCNVSRYSLMFYGVCKSCRKKSY